MAPLTGRKVLFIALAAFGVILAANLTLAVSAVRTFPGLEVKNSYVASQNFDEDRAAQLALGWNVAAQWSDGILTLAFTDPDGAPVEVAELTALVGWATSTRDDFTPEFTYDGTVYATPADLIEGNWNVRVRALAEDGTEFRQRIPLLVEIPQG